MAREVKCELCGGSFTCGTPGPCWCSGINLSGAQRSALSSIAGDCVCEECLRKAASTF